MHDDCNVDIKATKKGPDRQTNCQKIIYALSEAISSMGRRRNGSVLCVLVKQLTQV